MTTHNITIEIVRGSVVEQDVEAIVNAANTAMRGGVCWRNWRRPRRTG